MNISLIVAMTQNRVIGKDNDMPWHLPADLKHFKVITLGKPIIMGRKTYESIGRPLPKRRNIIITRQKDYKVDGAEVVHSMDEALALVKNEDEVMVIGGATLFEAVMPIANKIYLTEIQVELEGDTFFPKLDMDRWQVVSEEKYAADADNEYDLLFKVLVSSQ